MRDFGVADIYYRMWKVSTGSSFIGIVEERDTFLVEE